MAIPTVAIIGRPNVGKSSLLNALAGEMISIVEPTAGVTRDRVSTLIQREDRYFELVDTGGYGIVDQDHLEEHVENQITRALQTANLIIFMVDIRDGLTHLDEKIAQILRKQDIKVVGVANKADTAKLFPQAGEFTRLGFGDFLCLSATNNLNKNVLLDRIFENFSHLESETPGEPIMKIAVVGKRNAGKSTLVNAIVKDERVIVSEMPGTTRDAVDVRFEYNGKTIIVIDTAGVRKKNKLADSIEFYSSVRVTRSVMRADIILFMIDATLPISQVDKALAKLVTEEYKACIIVINKWDLAKDTATTDDYAEYMTKAMPMLKDSPIVFTTAKENKNVQSLLDLAAEIHKKATTILPTAKLNKAFEIIRAEHTPSKSRKVGFPRVFYATQISVNPVTILMFVNRPELFEENYMRYLRGRLQTLLPIDEIPVRLLARARERKEDDKK